MRTSNSIPLRFTLSLLLGACALAAEHPAVQLPAKDVARRFLVGSEPVNLDGTYNAVVLAPGKAKKGVRSVPSGLVPRSILAREKGGSGEPVTALILGAQPAAGALVKGRPLGLVTRTVAGRSETRVVFAAMEGALGSCRSLEEAEALDPGASAALKEGFGPAKGATFATKGRKEALRFLGDAITDFTCAYVTEADKRPLDKDGNPMRYVWSGARNIGE
ncbi:MAG: hypothetical protein P4L36_05320 [Holophaga sp.]|nr:hypothetical protein [Holophaga sp.]